MRRRRDGFLSRGGSPSVGAGDEEKVVGELPETAFPSRTQTPSSVAVTSVWLGPRQSCISEQHFWPPSGRSRQCMERMCHCD